MSDTSMYEIAKDISKDIKTDSLEYLEFYDVNLNDANSNDDFRIEIKEKENYYFPHKSFLKVDFQLKQDNNADFANGDNVSLQNNAVGLFKRWILEIEDKEVETVDDAQICNTVQKLVYYSDEHSSSIASSELWYPDTTATSVNEYVIVNGNNLFSQGIEVVNSGHRKRQQLLNASKVFSVVLPLKHIFGLFKSYKGVTKALKLGLRLDRNTNADLILNGVGGGADNGKVVLKSVKWYMPRVMPNASVLGMLVDQMTGGKKVVVPFVDAQLYRSPLFSEIPNNKLFQIRCKRQNPLKLFIAFQTQAVYEAGNKQSVKRTFSNIGLTRLRCVLNGTQQFPERELDCQFTATQKDYARAYEMFLQCGLKDHDADKGSIVKYDSFETLYPIFCIDMTKKLPKTISPDAALLDIYITATTQNFYAYCIVEAEREWYWVGDNGAMKHLGTNLRNKQM